MVKLQLFIESKALFDVITNGKKSPKMRLILDIPYTREGQKKKEIMKIGFICPRFMLAVRLIKQIGRAKLQPVPMVEN